MQASKEAKALAAANSSKGKKKVRSILTRRYIIGNILQCILLTALCCCTEMVQGQDEGEGEQPGFVRPGMFTPWTSLQDHSSFL